MYPVKLFAKINLSENLIIICKNVARSESENMIKNVLDGVMDTALQKSRVKAIMVDIKEYNLERVIIKEIEKERNIVTRSNGFSNDMSE